MCLFSTTAQRCVRPSRPVTVSWWQHQLGRGGCGLPASIFMRRAGGTMAGQGHAIVFVLFQVAGMAYGNWRVVVKTRRRRRGRGRKRSSLVLKIELTVLLRVLCAPFSNTSVCVCAARVLSCVHLLNTLKLNRVCDRNVPLEDSAPCSATPHPTTRINTPFRLV